MSQPSPQTGQAQDVDGANEQDHDALEDVLAAALVVLLVAWLTPGPSSLLGNSARFRRSQVLSAIGYALRTFIQRSAYDLSAAAGQAGAPPVLSIVDDVYTKVTDVAADWVEQSYQRLSGQDRLTESADPYARRDGGTEVRNLAQQAATNDARAIASYAKNEARNSAAGQLGALWSVWVSRHDNRVRESHRELDGAKVPYGGRFVVDGGRAYLRYPGDPEGPLSETMGCRCHLRFRFRPKETSYAEV